LVTQASTTPERRGISNNSAVRTVGYLVFLALAAPAAGMASQDSAAMGALVAAVFLLIIGTIGFVISRLRHRPRTWRQVAFGRAAVITTLALLILSAVGTTSANAATGDAVLKQRIARFVDSGMRHLTTECVNAPMVGRVCAASYMDTDHNFQIINTFQKPIATRLRFAFSRANRLQWQADLHGEGSVTSHWDDGYRTLVVDVRGKS
jgi:hypothetical protein